MTKITKISVSKDLITESNNSDPYRGAVANALSLSGFYGCKVSNYDLVFKTSSQLKDDKNSNTYNFNRYKFSKKLEKWMNKLVNGKKVKPITIKLNHKKETAYIGKEYFKGTI